MRLIDADQFEVISWRAQGGREYANGFDDGVDYVVQKIDKAETVEAIPVGWLLKKKASCIHMSNRSSQTAWLIGELIKEWRKEMGGE